MTAWDQPGAAQAAVNWYPANIPAFDDIRDGDYWPSKKAKVCAPILLIWTKNDPAYTLDTFNETPHYIDNLTIKTIDTRSHAPIIDYADEVIRHMQDFLHIRYDTKGS